MSLDRLKFFGKIQIIIFSIFENVCLGLDSFCRVCLDFDRIGKVTICKGWVWIWFAGFG